MLLFFLLFFGKGFRPPWQERKNYPGEGENAESALDILKKRYEHPDVSLHTQHHQFFLPQKMSCSVNPAWNLALDHINK